MKTVSASEAKQRLAAVIDAAARQPVLIRHQKRDVAVPLSIREYERLVRLNVSEFQQFCDKVGAGAKAAGLTEETLDELLADDYANVLGVRHEQVPIRRIRCLRGSPRPLCEDSSGRP
ncbi:MAG: type II toxin-antitoxin system Phd/YefM family antitoxin [Chromatiaceae bacterium]|nr:type II toxin-antitoxin system Phd/YefM family antitoxin [Chromatiaceae bacterium]